MNRTRLKVMLTKHEDLRLKPYRCTSGKLTIGVGRNLEDVGISNDEAAFLLDNDINRVFAELTKNVPSFGALDEVRQHVLMDMNFNLGLPRLLKFEKFLAAVEARDFVTAAREMLNSKWATQVGERAETLATMMRGAV